MEKSKTRHQQRSSRSSCYECSRSEEYVSCSGGVALHFLDMRKYNCDDSPLERPEITRAKNNKRGTSVNSIALTKVQTNLFTNAISKKLNIARNLLLTFSFMKKTDEWVFSITRKESVVVNRSIQRLGIGRLLIIDSSSVPIQKAGPPILPLQHQLHTPFC